MLPPDAIFGFARCRHSTGDKPQDVLITYDEATAFPIYPVRSTPGTPLGVFSFPVGAEANIEIVSRQMGK